MINDIKNRFEYYLFGRDKSYEKCDAAILDLECFELAKQMLKKHDTFVTRIKNPTKEQSLEYYEEVYAFLVDKFGVDSRLSEDVQTKLDALKNDVSYVRSDGRSYADTIIRIRAVFDLWHKE